MKSIGSSLGSFYLTPHFSSPCFLTISSETESVFGLHHFFCLNTPSWPVLQLADTHTAGSLSKRQLSQLSGGYQLCSAAGPTTLFVAYDRSNTNSHFGILFCSISPTEETFKRSVHLADLTQALLRFSPPRPSPQSWHGSWRSRSSTETSHHRSLTRA